MFKNLLLLFTTLAFFFIINLYKKTPDNPEPVLNFNFQPEVILKDVNEVEIPTAVKNLNCLYGKSKCDNCDCTVVCGSDEFEKILVEDDIIINNVKLDVGSYYCLPINKPYCDPKLSTSVFTTTGWRCIDKYPSLFQDGKVVACATTDGNYLNPLWDYKENKEIKNAGHLIGTSFDPNERLQDGRPRYGCKCIYRDDMGNITRYLPNIDPFNCFNDYCLANNSQTAMRGYDNGICNCDPLYNINNDVKLPCTACRDLIIKKDGKTLLTSHYTCFGLDSKVATITNVQPCPGVYFNDSKQLCNNFNITYFTKFSYENFVNI